MITSVINEAGTPVEISPGRGDLRRGSVPFVLDLRRYLELVERNVSFSRIFAQQPLIGMCVNWELRQSRRVPLRCYRRVEEDASMPLKPKDHPLAAGIASPKDGMDGAQLVAWLLGSRLVHGNALAPIDQGARNAIRFEPKDWRYSIPVLPWRGEIAGWEMDTDNPDHRTTQGAETVLHVHEWSPLGPFGISPLEQLGVTIAIEDAAKRHQKAQLLNGARPPSAIEADERFLGLKREERMLLMDQLRGDVDKLFAGPENAGRPPLLPPGLKWNAVGHTAVEAELINQRVVNREEAVSIYGLTPAVLGIIVRGAELPEQRTMAITEGLAPELILIEACINAQIAVGLLKEPDVYVAFDFTGILRGDKLKEIEAMRAAIGSAVLTPNEARDQLQLRRSNKKGMDDFYLPRNNVIPVDVPYQADGNAIGDGKEAETVPAGTASGNGNGPSEGD